MKLRKRSTIRFRLTVLYAAAFFLAGAFLIGMMYFLMQQSLERRPAGANTVVKEFFERRGEGSPPSLDKLVTTITEQAEREREETLSAMLIWSLAGLGAVGLTAGCFGWLLAGRALQPLQEVTATARRVAERHLHERIALDGPDDEIKELADTFDAMLERLDRAFDGQRLFAANASHELRTPLAINRTLIEVFLDDSKVSESTRHFGETLLAVTNRHERLIDGMLMLARSQRLEARSRVDLAEIARHATTTSATAANHARVEIEAHFHTAVVAGDPALLERIAQNLIDNAIRYNTPECGWVRVTVAHDVDAVLFTVENTGPPVSVAEAASLFEPFRQLSTKYEAHSRRGGSRGAGLGLSIVRTVVAVHGGEVRVDPRPSGGLVVTVRIPEAR